MEFNNLSRKELIGLLENIKKVLDGGAIYKSVHLNDITTNQQNDLENLIGTIPFLLHNRQIFEKNQDIADFAKKLDIYIPSAEKKKREDIIGRIVSAIGNFDNQKLAELNLVIKSIKKSGTKKEKVDFFKDWENAIKQMKI